MSHFVCYASVTVVIVTMFFMALLRQDSCDSMGPWEFSAVWDISWNLLAFTGLLRPRWGRREGEVRLAGETFGVVNHDYAFFTTSVPNQTDGEMKAQRGEVRLAGTLGVVIMITPTPSLRPATPAGTAFPVATMSAIGKNSLPRMLLNASRRA